MTGRGAGPLLSVAAVVLATVAGGALGVAVVRPEWTSAVPLLLLVLAVVAVAGVLVQLAVAGRPAPARRSASWDRPGPPSENSWPAGDRDGYPRDGGRVAVPRSALVPSVPPGDPVSPVAPGPDVSVAYPVPSRERWWENAGPPPASRGGPPPGPAAVRPDPATYLDTSVLAQCPACGSFDLDVRPSPPGYGFRCNDCDETWTWRREQEWPPLQVDPARRRSRTARES